MRFLIGIVFLIIVFAANAQAPKKFYSTYGGNGYDVGYDVKQTLDGGYIITGSTSSYGQGNTDMYLLKLDSMGQVKFQKTFGGVSNEIGKSIVQLADSSYVMAGYTSSSGVGGYDVFLVKADKTGNLIWQKTYGGSDWDFANSMDTTSDGGFIIAGTTYSYGKGNADGFVIKTDANGDTLWTKTYGGVNDDEFKSVIQTTDGNYALTGYTKSFNDVDSGDVWVFKLDVLGDTLWRKFYGEGKEDFGNEIIEHPNGDFFIAGGTSSFGVNKMNAYALHLDNGGNYIFQRLDNTSTSTAFFNSVKVSSRTPNVLAYIATVTLGGYGLQFKLLEMNLGLNYINGSTSGSNLTDEAFKIVTTKDKGYTIIGYTNGFGAINTDVYIVKVDSSLTAGNYSIISVKENEVNNFSLLIYPNPTSAEINIKSNIEININEFKIYDISGQEIFIDARKTVNSSKEGILNIENLNNGIYFLRYLNKTEKISIIH